MVELPTNCSECTLDATSSLGCRLLHHVTDEGYAGEEQHNEEQEHEQERVHFFAFLVGVFYYKACKTYAPCGG